MHKRSKVLALSAVLLLLSVGLAWHFKNMISYDSKAPLRVVFPGHWGSLSPALQHTAIGSSIILNVFEPLLMSSLGGTVLPLGAKSWEILDDHKRFRFKIDTSRRFSNGVKLSAKHYKDTWERGLALTPMSANSSLADVMSKVQGFEHFDKTKTLSGVTVLADDLLEIRFSTPFRMVLDELSGARFSAVLEMDGKEIGTGAYTVEKANESTVLLKKNPHSEIRTDFEYVEVSGHRPELAVQRFNQGKADVLMLVERAGASVCNSSNDDIKCYIGEDAAHRVVHLNGLKERLFSDVEMRQAAQALIFKIAEKHRASQSFSNELLRLDPQFLLPLQLGRLSETEATRMAQSGEKFIEAFIAKSKAKPLTYLSPFQGDWIWEGLKNAGVAFSPESGIRDTKFILDQYYKDLGFDMIVGTSSVWNGDPDGVYHLLGKHGAITSPAIARPKVQELLETGRMLLDNAEMKAKYEEASRMILTEVPSVHIGYLSSTVATWKRQVVISTLAKRQDVKFQFFESP